MRTVFDSVGKYLMATCAHPGAYVRRAAWDAAAGVREAMAEVERTMSELGKKIPDDLSARLSNLGSEIADMVKQIGRAHV